MRARHKNEDTQQTLAGHRIEDTHKILAHHKMDKPLCKLCDHRHSGVDHVWDKATEATQQAHKKTSLKGRLKGFDRVTYQREYMRKWRKRKQRKRRQ